MLTRRAAILLLIAAVAGTAGGVLIARLTETSGPGGTDVVGLGHQESVDSAAGTLTLASPDDWFAGSTNVNCNSSPDAHASNEQVALESFTVRIGTGSTCLVELDPRPLSSSGVYVTATLFPVQQTLCGTGISNDEPATLADVPVSEPPMAALREAHAEEAYDVFEWRHLTWCVGGGWAARLETFLGDHATPADRDLVDVVVQALEFEPAPSASPTD